MQEWRRKSAKNGNTANRRPIREGNRNASQNGDILVLLSAGQSLAAKPHYEIAGQVVAIADGDTLIILD